MTEQPETYAATMRLRGRGGPLPVGVFWPPEPRRRRRLVVAIGVGPERARALCARTRRIVLATEREYALTGGELDDLLAWVGAHAAELGARPDNVLVAASDGCDAVAELRHRTGSADWPRIGILHDLDS
jgi:hypothetical protein